MNASRLFLLLAATGCVMCGGTAALAQAGVLTPAQAALRLQQGEAFERKHDLRSAFDAYSEAGEAGNGLAQKKLGDFYSSGNVAVDRNYETALKWYSKAREQGIEIPKPLTYPGTPVDSASR
jgi:TPR repeat protein